MSLECLKIKGRRATSNEPTPQTDLFGPQEVENKVTLKPNEIVLPRIDPRENKNFITKHHLDDTELYWIKNILFLKAFSKSTLNEVGIIYFPEKEKKEEIKKQEKILAQHKELIKEKNTAKQKKKEQKKENEIHPPQPAFFSLTRGPQDENQHESSIHKTKRTEEYKAKPLQPHNREDNVFKTYIYDDKKEASKQKLGQNTFGPSHNKHEMALPEKKTQKSKSKAQKHGETHGKTRERKKHSQSRLNATETEGYHREYNDVESKIKDEVQYHKGLSQQYKKMKENMKQYDSYIDNEASQSSRGFAENHREHKTMPRHRLSQETSRYQSGYYDNSKLLDSASSARKSMQIPHYSGHLLERTGDENMSAAKHRKTEMTAKNEDFSYYKSLGGDNQGGILDIANSFLNSPLMQHLSNIDSKDSETSSKVSSTPEENSKKLLRVTNFDSRSPPGFIKSPNKRYGVDEDLRRLEPQSAKNYRPITHQHKYSDWVGVYKTENDGKDSYSLLKESDHKRFAENLSKDSSNFPFLFSDLKYTGGYYSKDDTSSLTSSAFTNYLDDEMKGKFANYSFYLIIKVFFQKETYELNKGKTSRSKAGGSRNPPNISFHGHELAHTSGDLPGFHSRKVTHHTQYDTTNKSYSGLPTDHMNIFKNDRMNGTRLLNNT